MKGPAAHFPSLIGIALLLFSFTFGAGFWFSYQQEKKTAADFFHATWLHLNYILTLRDDMALIDWSKDIEKNEKIMAFRVKGGAQGDVEGGNRDYLFGTVQKGFTFHYPSRWTLQEDWNIDHANMCELVLVYRSDPNPFMVGLYGALLLLLGGILSFCFSHFLIIPRKNPHHSYDPETWTREPINIEPLHLSPTGQENKPFLFLDNQFLIQRVSPEAARIFDKHTGDLLGRHLLDLEPNPSLMRAIEKAMGGKVLNPFLSLPGLWVSLRIDPQGTWLVFEPVKETETP